MLRRLREKYILLKSQHPEAYPDMSAYHCWIAGIAISMLLLPLDAQATPANSVIACTLCNIVSWLNGTTAKVIATLAINFLGVNALMGKLSKEAALVVAMGIALMFGASRIVTQLGGNGGACTALGGCAAGPANTMMINVLCNVASWFTGTTGKTIATLGIFAVGAGALFGKLSWQLALAVAMGVAMIFGSATLVDQLVPPQVGCTSAPVVDTVFAPLLCNIVGWLTGSVGKALATLAIFTLGAGAFFGRISWILALTVAIGVAMIFGAALVVDQLWAGQTPCPAGSTDVVFTRVLCNIAGWVTGSTGKALATLAVFTVGVGTLSGKLSWQKAILVAVGVGLVFSAAFIVEQLAGPQAGCTGNQTTDVVFGRVLCNIVNWLNGGAPRAFAALAIVGIGVGALFGKVNAQAAVFVALGIAIIFGSAVIVQQMGGVAAACTVGNITPPVAPPPPR